MSTRAFDVEATEDHLALVAAIEEFVAGEACRLAIVTHVGLPSFARASYSKQSEVPGASDAARQLFYGLPSTKTSDGGAFRSQRSLWRGPQVVGGQGDVSLPVKGEAIFLRFRFTLVYRCVWSLSCHSSASRKEDRTARPGVDESKKESRSPESRRHGLSQSTWE